jgi:hypothetical protein
MAKFEVAYVKREVLFTRYYITVEAESASAAMRKVEGYDTTPEEDETVVEGKCIGMGESCHIEEAEWAHELEKEDA